MIRASMIRASMIRAYVIRAYVIRAYVIRAYVIRAPVIGAPMTKEFIPGCFDCRIYIPDLHLEIGLLSFCQLC